jgi:hypothetical protein
MKVWFACWEDKDGILVDDPLMADSEQEIYECAQTQWGHHKLDRGERIAIYQGTYKKSMNLNKEPSND